MTIPTLTDERRLMMWAGGAHATLYLSMVFVAGLVTDHRMAYLFAIVSTGFAYFSSWIKSYEVRFTRYSIGLARIAFIVSIVAGTQAGIFLI